MRTCDLARAVARAVVDDHEVPLTRVVLGEQGGKRLRKDAGLVMSRNQHAHARPARRARRRRSLAVTRSQIPGAGGVQKHPDPCSQRGDADRGQRRRHVSAASKDGPRPYLQPPCTHAWILFDAALTSALSSSFAADSSFARSAALGVWPGFTSIDLIAS